MVLMNCACCTGERDYCSCLRVQFPERAVRHGLMDQRRQAIIEEIPRLRRYARSLLRDREAADDLVQDSLERALSRMESWTTGESPRRWLFSIMHHLFVDQLRRAKRHVQAVAMMPETIDAL